MYLTLLNGTGFVFNVDGKLSYCPQKQYYTNSTFVSDYMELRSKHRIMGAPVGTANTKGWSPNQSSEFFLNLIDISIVYKELSSYLSMSYIIRHLF